MTSVESLSPKIPQTFSRNFRVLLAGYKTTQNTKDT
jgi:hypothetical protein